MDANRFDAFARTTGRRGLVAAALALIGVGSFSRASLAGQPLVCNLSGPGLACRSGSECCSGSCIKKKRKKKKGKKRKKQKAGTCACSALRQPCFRNQDCCGEITGLAGSIVCSAKAGFAEIVCCVSSTGECESDNDCCDGFSCNNGVCDS
jgi:hypothetical protein